MRIDTDSAFEYHTYCCVYVIELDPQKHSITQGWNYTSAFGTLVVVLFDPQKCFKIILIECFAV